jgi:hypothetical protein
MTRNKKVWKPLALSKAFNKSYTITRTHHSSDLLTTYNKAPSFFEATDWQYVYQLKQKQIMVEISKFLRYESVSSTNVINLRNLTALKKALHVLLGRSINERRINELSFTKQTLPDTKL